MMKYKYLLLLFLLSNCTKRDCVDLIFKNGITYLDKTPFTGTCKSYFMHGPIKSEEFYKDGLDAGTWTIYFSNGNIRTKGSFENGKKEGKWEYFYENGNLWIEQDFKNGSPKGTKIEYDSNGKLISKSIYN